MSTNSIFTSAFIYRGIKLEYISLNKYYSFPFTNTTVAIVTAIAIVRA